MIHDFGYSVVATPEEQFREDRRLWDNALTLVDEQTGNLVLSWLRHRRVLKYFKAVRFGGSGFIAGEEDK